MKLAAHIFSSSGLKIITDINLTISKKEIRTYKERLFSLHPFRKYKYIQIPDPNYYVVGDKVICHPILANKLKELTNVSNK